MSGRYPTPPRDAGTSLADLSTWAGDRRKDGNVFAAILGASEARRNRWSTRHEMEAKFHEENQRQIRQAATKDEREVRRLLTGI